MKPNDQNYFFAHDGFFVLPIEHLGPDGICEAFSKSLIEHQALDAPSIELFNQAFSRYWKRAARLHEKAPRYWFPPRIQHVCISSTPNLTRPYFQPFNKNSWLLYAADLGTGTSSLEFLTYQFLHVERMGLIGQVIPTLYANLSYFLTLTDTQLQDFRSGCRKTTRPDASGYRALLKALPQLGRLGHESLKPPRSAATDSHLFSDTGLIAPVSLRRPMESLQQAWANAAQSVFKRHRAAHARPSPTRGTRVIEWLLESRPPLLVTGTDGKIIWDPKNAETTAPLTAALVGITDLAESSICEDLKTVAFHSRRFLDALQTPEELVDPAPYITEGGLSYIHRQRKLIGYNIGPPENEHRLWESTPPYERFMLAARTVHEWGHLAAESGWVIIPEHLRVQRETLTGELAELFEAIHAEAPLSVQQHAAREVASLRQKADTLGQGLVRGMLTRIEDYMANLVAHRFLRADEMDTYVRNNVCSHLQDYQSGSLYNQLCRGAYEYQYLRLSRIEEPLEWYLKSTWFAEHFIRQRVITVAQFEALIVLIGRICDCYQIDESRFDFSRITD